MGVKMIDTTGWPVMKAKCKSCPFGPNGDPGVKAGVIQRLIMLEHSQICHHPNLVGKKEDHLCKGGRDFQQQILYRIGILEAPTDAAWEKANKKSLK